MIRLEHVDVYGFEAAVRGMRNPMNSWDRSDSAFYRLSDTMEHPFYPDVGNYEDGSYIGVKDLALAEKLANAGPVHAKYRRMITVYMDITAPLYWWKEFDTYKVGTVANSCSTMHKIAEKEFTIDDFSWEHLRDIYPDEDESVRGLTNAYLNTMMWIIRSLNEARTIYLNYDEVAARDEHIAALSKKDIWWQMIQLLPSSYNQRRTVMLNYEVLAHLYSDRKNHKLDEWREFCRFIEGLPYSKLITTKNEKE